MVGRKKKTRSKEDKISQLPDHIACDILSYLSTKDTVRTSVLSTRWRNLWKSVPGLDLNSSAFSNVNNFVSFTERFFSFHKESWIRKLRLNIEITSNGKPFLTSWIDAVTTRRIQYLDVGFEYIYPQFQAINIPLSLYTCETLVNLRLFRVILANVAFVSLPCLKIMHFDNVIDRDATMLQKFISGSPVLEDLTIIRSLFINDMKTVLQVRSHTVKKIHINEFTQVVIDAPLLQCFRTKIISGKNYKIIGLGFPNKLDIDFYTGTRVPIKSMILDILTDISRVRDLVIGSNIWKVIWLYKKKPSLLFRNLCHLNATFHISELELLPTLLESCPKLESFILEVAKNYLLINKEQKVVFSVVPRCLASSLKFVEFKRSVPKYDGEMELVRYFLKNSIVLEKLRFGTYITKNQSMTSLKNSLQCQEALVLVNSLFFNY